MIILKWYSILFTIIMILLTITKIIEDNEKEKRIAGFISLIIYIPILIYLILK